MKDELSVGSTVYHRIAAEPVKIVGETKLSWLVEVPRYWVPNKVKKAAMRKGNSGEYRPLYYVNKQDALDVMFAYNNRHRIAIAVEDLMDFRMLRQVAELIGYKEQP